MVLDFNPEKKTNIYKPIDKIIDKIIIDKIIIK